MWGKCRSRSGRKPTACFTAKWSSPTRSFPLHTILQRLRRCSDSSRAIPIPACQFSLVSTGLPYVLVPLKSRDAISKISIDCTRALPWLERVDPDAMFYSYTLAGREKNGTIQGRGIFPNGEDPATGSASGCLVSLLVKQGRLGTGEQILIEQGDQIHRPSRIYGSAAIRGGKVHSVHIGGVRNPGRERRVRPVME